MRRVAEDTTAGTASMAVAVAEVVPMGLTVVTLAPPNEVLMPAVCASNSVQATVKAWRGLGASALPAMA